MIEYLWLIPAIIVHELGHYIGFRIYNFRPKVKLRWWGVEVGDNVASQLIPKQAVLVYGLGIITGMLVLIFSTTEVMMIYLFMCMVDIVGLLNLSSVKKHQMKMTLLDIAKERIEEESIRLEQEKLKLKDL